MKANELIYRELLKNSMENGKSVFTQLELSKSLEVSLSTVHNALAPLRKMGAIKVNQRNFEIINTKKILYYWASTRNIEKDIIYKTRADFKGTIAEIEKQMPPSAVFGAYTAYKYRYKDAPSDYSEVYVYCPDQEVNEIKKRFPEKIVNPNIFVLRKDFKDTEMPAAHIFVDLWNIKEWYASEFLKALEEKWNISTN